MEANDLVPQGDFLLLMDASAYFHRAYHANAKTVRRRDGHPTGAAIAFCWSMMKIFRLGKTALGRRPTHGAVVMDSRLPNFRHELYPAYKANRAGYEEDLERQLKFIPQAAAAFNVPCIQVDGWEADDIIATYATIAPLEGLPVVIASSDKDFGQLVGDRVLIYDPMKEVKIASESRVGADVDLSPALINTDKIYENWGVWPWQMVDMQALIGDTVDNVPGLHGIGPKKAAKLIQQFHTLEQIMEAADWSDDGFKPKEYAAIMEGFATLPLAKQLVTLDRAAPVPNEPLELRLHDARSMPLKDFLEGELEAPQLARRVDF